MAPRKKKPRLSSQPASTPSVIQATPTPTPASSPSRLDGMSPEKSDFTLGPWTDEQETALFKGMIQWKPVGMHKHFRMLSISNYLTTHGHTHPALAPHTRIPGIWTKLGQLYDLRTLDEREDAFPLSPVSGEAPPTDTFTEEPFTEFTLPYSEYGPTMLERAVAKDDKEVHTEPKKGKQNKAGRGRRQSTLEQSTGGEDQEEREANLAAEPPLVKGRRTTRASKKDVAIPEPVEQSTQDTGTTRRSGRRR